ncbi:hypothetical protein MAE02_30030 [Microvirga aerophila]|uniref:Uncharacterized protein n=1 Tax=Microvirga aerophila TaxID=670291 RepID=A0A512BU25_9HYPH|nr:hypothetical protein MAE02_30030 [Microvirga aerophila]
MLRDAPRLERRDKDAVIKRIWRTNALAFPLLVCNPISGEEEEDTHGRYLRHA